MYKSFIVICYFIHLRILTTDTPRYAHVWCMLMGISLIDYLTRQCALDEAKGSLQSISVEKKKKLAK